MSFWTPHAHRHRWRYTDSTGIAEPGKDRASAQIRTYMCWHCGAIRYDKIDGGGFVSSTVTDELGIIVSYTESGEPVAAPQAQAEAA